MKYKNIFYLPFFVDDTGYNKIIGYPKERYNAQELLETLKDSDVDD